MMTIIVVGDDGDIFEKVKIIKFEMRNNKKRKISKIEPREIDQHNSDVEKITRIKSIKLEMGHYFQYIFQFCSQKV